MKACVIHAAKDLRIEDHPIPAPGPGEVRLKLKYVGICGSDLHYYHDGRVGASVVRQPMVLGHELSAVIDAVGQGVTEFKPGRHVTVNPSSECERCEYCLTGRQNLCPSLRYLGSAAQFPHTQGVMREYSVVRARQCIGVADALDMRSLACVEPLGIALHAAGRAGDLLGKRVFISGSGPIGALIAAVASFGGAANVAISDLEPFPLSIAKRLGATETVNARDEAALGSLEASCDVAFEASGNVNGMKAALTTLKAGGKFVHVGYLGDELVSYPVNRMLLQREITVTGSQRAYHEFALAASLLETGRIDVSPLITSVFPLERAEEAILRAGDKTQSMKVLLSGD